MEQKKEQLKYETELLRLAWVTAVAIGGGAMSLLLSEATTLRTGLLGLGFLLILVSARGKTGRFGGSYGS